jgi:hypothetical protein
MGREPIVPYPKNAPGSFYTEDESCMACEAPCSEAPDLIAHDQQESGHHCYFKKQPETPEETERAIMACVVSCIEAVRYAGHDPEILKRFRQLRSQSSCDALTRRPGPGGQAHPLWDEEVDR